MSEASELIYVLESEYICTFDMYLDIYSNIHNIHHTCSTEIILLHFTLDHAVRF